MIKHKFRSLSEVNAFFLGKRALAEKLTCKSKEKFGSDITEISLSKFINFSSNGIGFSLKVEYSAFYDKVKDIFREGTSLKMGDEKTGTYKEFLYTQKDRLSAILIFWDKLKKGEIQVVDKDKFKGMNLLVVKSPNRYLSLLGTERGNKIISSFVEQKK